MMAATGAGYNRAVFGRWRWRGAATLFLALSCWIFLAAAARAGEQIPVGPTPWLDVQLESGTLTVNTWDRPQVQVVTSGRVDLQHVNASQADPRIPRQYTAWSQNVATPQGDVMLPEESFVLPRLAGSAHDEVVARGQGNTTVTIPRGTALVTAGVGTGQLNLQNYRGAFIAHVADGSVTMNHVSGTGYVESLQGPVSASNSSFDRLRVRTATGNMFFRGCTSHQIEASSTYGSIVYDNGRFQPGLAHFESVHGNVALGVRGSAQIGARSGSGRMAQTTVRGGGPVVTAVSKHGNVYIYRGSARAGFAQPAAAPAQALRPATAPALQNYPARQYQVPARGYALPARNYSLPPRSYAPQRGYDPQRGYAAPPRNYTPPREDRAQTRQGAPPGGGGDRHGGGHQPPRFRSPRSLE